MSDSLVARVKEGFGREVAKQEGKGMRPLNMKGGFGDEAYRRIGCLSPKPSRKLDKVSAVNYPCVGTPKVGWVGRTRNFNNMTPDIFTTN